MTVGQFERAIEGYSKRLETEARQTDQLNHILGEYIAFAVNDPKKYPKQPKLHEPQKTEYKPESFQQLAKRRWGKKK